MHGGSRPGAGRKSSWIRGKTVVIRVPESLSEEVLRVAHLMDEGKTVDDVTKSRYLNFSDVPIRYSNGEPVVYIRDLLRLGFKIRPLDLVDRLRKELDRRF